MQNSSLIQILESMKGIKMKHSGFVLCAWQAAALVSLLAVPAWSSVLYSDGGINGIIGANYINSGHEVSDSFTISSNSTVTMVSNVGLWTLNPDIPGTVSWVISTSHDGGGTVEGSGSGVSLSTTFLELGQDPDYAIYSASFSVGSLALSAGTYYLELEDAATTSGSPSGPGVLWDVVSDSAPSTEYENGILGTNPNSFEIDGTEGTVPEPTAWSLSGLGIALLGGAALRKSLEKQRKTGQPPLTSGIKKVNNYG